MACSSESTAITSGESPRLRAFADCSRSTRRERKPCFLRIWVSEEKTGPCPPMNKSRLFLPHFEGYASSLSEPPLRPSTGHVSSSNSPIPALLTSPRESIASPMSTSNEAIRRNAKCIHRQVHTIMWKQNGLQQLDPFAKELDSERLPTVFQPPSRLGQREYKRELLAPITIHAVCTTDGLECPGGRISHFNLVDLLCNRTARSNVSSGTPWKSV